MNLDLGRGNGITCPNCRQPFAVQAEQIIDVGRDPAAKARFLSGQSRVATCPHCGFQSALTMPVLYHDPEKELFLVYVPVELGLQKEQQEQVVGQLVKAVMDATPAEQRRGYMFQPRQMLSLQGMVETIMQGDGVTPEMLEAQRAKARLVDVFLQADEDTLPDLIQEYNEQIDPEFIQILSMAADEARFSGRAELADHAALVRDRVIELSAAGEELIEQAQAQEAAIQEVTEALQGLSEQTTLDEFLDLVLSFGDNDLHLQALVGLQFPAFEYQFFQTLGQRIEQAAAEDRAWLEDVRDRLLALTNMIREQQQAVVQASVQVLQTILQSEDVESAVMQNLPHIDETFMMVLASNIEEAQKRQDLVASARLKQIYEVIMKVLREAAPPALQFISRLIQAGSDAEAQQMVQDEVAQYGPEILDIMDSLVQDLASRGDVAHADRVQMLREQAAGIVG